MKTIREQAMDFLARREHSRQELRQKLLRKGHDEAIIETTLQQLVSDNLQSDERFAEAYIRSKVAAGYGPLKIKSELQHRGVSQDIIHQHLPSDKEFWKNALQTLWREKYDNQVSKDHKILARQFRFLLQRGFSIEAIRELLEEKKR